MDCFCNCYQTVFAYLVAFSVYQIGNTIITGSFTIATIIAIIVVIGFIYLLVRPYKESKNLDVNLDNVVTQK